jgi:hypothetical protein
MPIFILSRYNDPPPGERGRLKVMDGAIEADTAVQAVDIAEQFWGPSSPGKYAILWDEQANIVWEQYA